MASAVTTARPSANLKVLSFDFDPDASTAVDVSWQDMRDFGWVLMELFRSVGTGAVDAFKILANAESAGSGTDATVKEHAAPTAADAVGNYLFLEALASELPPLGANLRYVSAQIELAVDSDECVVTYIFGEPRFAYSGLTADNVA